MALFGLIKDKDNLSEDQVRALFKEKNNVELIDVRTAGEFRTGHINPCLNINVMDKAEFSTKTKYLDKEKTYVLYCQSGRRSSKAKRKLAKMGFTNVYELKGGITQWVGQKRVK